jgi:hypothetical protein
MIACWLFGLKYCILFSGVFSVVSACTRVTRFRDSDIFIREKKITIWMSTKERVKIYYGTLVKFFLKKILAKKIKMIQWLHSSPIVIKMYES